MTQSAPAHGSYKRYPRPAVYGLLFLSAYGLQCHEVAVMPGAHPPTAGSGWDADAGPANVSDERLAATDPLAFLRRCRAHYDEFATDYRCRFIKQERMNGVLGKAEHIDVLFREKPFSVDMRWVKNPRAAKHVSFVAGRWVDDGREYFLVEPAGVLGLLAPQGVKQDIHGERARNSSRRRIDQFGFKNSLDLIIKYCDIAAGKPGYALRYAGKGSLDGRPCFIIERELPYTGEDGPYPDRLLVVYIDAEWLVPVGVYAYADLEKKELLGSYVQINVEFNTGLTDAQF